MVEWCKLGGILLENLEHVPKNPIIHISIIAQWAAPLIAPQVYMPRGGAVPWWWREVEGSKLTCIASTDPKFHLHSVGGDKLSSVQRRQTQNSTRIL